MNRQHAIATHRRCFVCGASGAQAVFATRRKPLGRRDYCAIHDGPEHQEASLEYKQAMQRKRDAIRRVMEASR